MLYFRLYVYTFFIQYNGSLLNEILDDYFSKNLIFKSIQKDPSIKLSLLSLPLLLEVQTLKEPLNTKLSKF